MAKAQGRLRAGKMAVCDGPQFDFCYALADLASPDPRLSSDLFKVPPKADWLEAARAIGWSLWFAVPHLLDDPTPAATITQFIDRLSSIAPSTIAPRLRRALVHSDTAPSGKKTEWLHFIGFDPSRLPRLELHEIIAVLEAFSPHFEQVRARRRPQLAAIRDRAEAVAHRGSFADAIDEFDLPIEMDASRQCLRALRGGHTLPFKDIGTVYLVPTVFNARRLWNTVDRPPPATILLPVGKVEPDDLRREYREPSANVDPWLACRAIGDPVRATMLRMIAEAPRTASDLAAGLGLSKATVSHHVFQLREAGLIQEARDGRFTQLSVRLDIVDRISGALRKELEGGRSSAISRVRSGA